MRKRFVLSDSYVFDKSGNVSVFGRKRKEEQVKANKERGINFSSTLMMVSM